MGAAIKILAVDESGTTTPIGPIVVGAVLLHSYNQLGKIRVCDSKKLTQSQRAVRFRRMIAKGIDIHSIFLLPNEIDRAKCTDKSSVKRLQLTKVRELVDRIKPDVVLIHRLCVNKNLYMDIFEGCGCRVKFVNHEDEYRAVAAASIVATHTRTMIMKSLSDKYGLGSGEFQDNFTRKFISKNLETGSPHIRYSFLRKTLKKGMI